MILAPCMADPIVRRAAASGHMASWLREREREGPSGHRDQESGQRGRRPPTRMISPGLEPAIGPASDGDEQSSRYRGQPSLPLPGAARSSAAARRGSAISAARPGGSTSTLPGRTPATVMFRHEPRSGRWRGRFASNPGGPDTELAARCCEQAAYGLGEARCARRKYPLRIGLHGAGSSFEVKGRPWPSSNSFFLRTPSRWRRDHHTRRRGPRRRAHKACREPGGRRVFTPASMHRTLGSGEEGLPPPAPPAGCIQLRELPRTATRERPRGSSEGQHPEWPADERC
jgi:hypothetical protein